ncbi:hypothetical protein RHGRI_008728 [Rhododendron griersonianum]|uniref:Pectinesterase inhibitor domain-containing protein n=1 Tax=Rhododendron griersonianum TaxID=479676 RepID=A0AAV6L2F8_9ERIC|nr:hypothetical protein RHGRI_008728 [Rhododendron griersonianum]
MARIATLDIGFVLLVCFAISVVNAKTAGKDNGGCSETVRDQLCHYTGYYDVCVAAINADPRSNLKLCPRGILRILIDRTLSNVTVLNNHIAHLLNDPHTDADTRDSLKGCASVYAPAVHDLKHDLRLIGFKNYQEYYRLRTDVDVLESCPYGCERSFIQRPKPARSPLTSINNDIQKLTGLMLRDSFDYMST